MQSSIAPAPLQPLAPWDTLLAHAPLVVLDGGLATELERRGADLRDPLWSAKVLIDQPEMIRAVHREYFEAGADIATTATYQATFEGFAARGIDTDGAAHLMRRAVELAVQARDEFWDVPANRIGRGRPLVAASIGPYGAMLADGSEYRGRYAAGDTELEVFYRRRLQVLTASAADVLGFETFPGLREALVVARLLEREFSGLPAWISFSCRDATRTYEDDAVEACAQALDGFAQITAIGVNCTQPEHIGSVLRLMSNRSRKPLIAYPNAGQAYDASSGSWLGDARTEPVATLARSWYEAGARIIGGCCGTTPAHIRSLKRLAPQLDPACSVERSGSIDREDSQ